MRTLLFIFVFIPFFAFAQPKNADQLLNGGFKKYENRSGKITYTLTGNAEGAEILIFDKFGWQSMRRQTMIFELYGLKTMQTLHEITNGDFNYRLNEGDSSLVSGEDFKWSQLASKGTPEEASEAMLFSLGGTHATDSTLLDKSCQVWTFSGKALQELWIWEGLVLKRKTKLGDQIIHSIANAIELEIDPEPTVFEIPPYLKEKE